MKSDKPAVKLMFVEGNTEHKVLKINPQILKLAAWSVPLTTIILLVILASLSITFYQKVASVQYMSSKKNSDWASQNAQFQKTIVEQEKQIKELNEKMIAPADNASSLQLFVTTKGYKDLTPQSLVNVENLSFSIQANVIDVKFELHNQSGSERMTGYFFVLTYTPEQLIFYPPHHQVNTELNFSQGETFNIGRFKNVIFKTPVPPNVENQKIKVKIVAFSRTGDLLFNKGFDIQ